MALPRVAILALALLAVAGTPVATTDISGCGLTPTRDLNLRQLDRAQSSGAAKICAIYLNVATEIR